MLDCRKMALGLTVLCTVTTMTLAKAQQGIFSDGERMALAACLLKCPDRSPACNNGCISQAQTKGRMWGDDVRTCVRGCRSTAQTRDVILACVTGCRLDRTVQ
jgi:hypothetical protein